jgi:hypothetical protein
LLPPVSEQCINQNTWASVNHKLRCFSLDNIRKLVTANVKFIPQPLTKLLLSSMHHKFRCKWWVYTTNVFAVRCDRDQCNQWLTDRCMEEFEWYFTVINRRLNTGLSLTLFQIWTYNNSRVPQISQLVSDTHITINIIFVLYIHIDLDEAKT